MQLHLKYEKKFCNVLKNTLFGSWLNSTNSVLVFGLVLVCAMNMQIQPFEDLL